MSSSTDPSVQTSIEEVWFLKDIFFRPDAEEQSKRIKIITQNFNGPCSFIAICNILILRGDIEVLPPERKSVSYEFLSQLVGEYLLTSSSDVDISAALSIMPYTRKGMDLNPLFSGASSFRPAGTGGELKLFEQAGIKLVHGWLADPDSPEYAVLVKAEDYDSAVNLIVEADHVAKGQLVVSEDELSSSQAGSSGSASGTGPALSEEDQKKVEAAIVVRGFIDSTQSQLTYYGLFTLASTLIPGSLVALFRNSHLSVLFKSPNPEDSALYTLVTDQVFLNESSVVWERIEDVDGGASSFVDSDFVRSSPAGGDYAGHTGESALAALEEATGALTLEEQADQALARQLQAMEDAHAQHLRQQHSQRMEQRQAEVEQREQEREERKKKKKDCVIM